MEITLYVLNIFRNGADMDNKNLNQYENGNGYNNGRGPGGPGQGGPNGPGGQNNNKKPSLMFILMVALFTILMVSFLLRMVSSGGSSSEISYSEFLAMVEEGKVERVEISSDMSQMNIYTKDSEEEEDSGFPDWYIYGSLMSNSGSVYYTGYVNDEELIPYLKDKGVDVSREIPDNSGMLLSILLTYVLPVVLVLVFFNFLFRKMSGSGGPMGVGKSTAKVYVQKETGVTFKDVAGVDEAKESLVEVVDFLHNPGRYSKIGAKLPKGALLVGPPGTGKTLLAKAVAGEAGVPFFSLTGSDFIEMYVGVGASRVRDLFKEANKNAPCIVFIDEIDAIGRSRDSKYGGGNEEREQTLNQLLSEMDGFDSSKGVLILGATNRPEILDKALLRPGRFDRRIIVERPDLKGRVEILKVHSKDVKMDETVDLKEIALATSGAVGSDLANMINEAAIIAVKDKRELVSQKDLFEAVEQVLMGKEKKDRVMSQKERKIVAYHEVGHALISALQKNTEPVQKITIVPRTKGALGYVMQVPEEEKYLKSKTEMEEEIVVCMGGRAAEELVFNMVTSGAANDIEQATSMARSMVTRFGMSEKFGLMGLARVESQYLENRAVLDCSERTSAQVDEEVMRMLKESYAKALELLQGNRSLMDKIAEHLLEKETITGKEFMKIYRAEKGIPEPEEEESAGEKIQKEIELAEPFISKVEPITFADAIRLAEPVNGKDVEEQKTEEEAPVQTESASADEAEEADAKKDSAEEKPVQGVFSGSILTDSKDK